MKVLGWSEGFHDAAVCVLDGPDIKFASHSERFSKKKHDKYVGEELKNYVEDNFDLRFMHKAFYEKPFLKKTRQLYARQFKSVFRERPMTWHPDSTWHHHKSHAAAAFQTSNYTQAAAVVIDSIGEWDTLTIWKCTYKKGRAYYEKRYNYVYPNSIGLWYTALTHYAKLKPLDEEYIFMGMAAYGVPNLKLKTTLKDMLRSNINLHKGVPSNYKINLSQYSYEDISFNAQEVLEDELRSIFAMAQQISKNIVYGGGVALNCLANGRLLDQVHPWIMPNPGDAGGALGAACLAYGEQVNWKSPYLGYDMGMSKQKSKLADDIVDHLLKYGMAGVAVGKAEYGPRALGNRSLLADPRGSNVKDMVNKIKRRQLFRPFAPTMLEEHRDTYFEPAIKSPYMSFVVNWLDDETPAVMHKDGTSRVQTVPKNSSSLLRAILIKWYDKTGCPVLLNTSLNIRGEPMVNDLHDAKRFEERYGVRVFN